jgi:poly(3-hydroxybutyrate) depolymerase
MKRIGWILLLLAVAAPVWAKTKIARKTFEFEGKVRTYYLYVPEITDPMPVLMILHGYPRLEPANGHPMVNAWKDLASKENLIVVAPNAEGEGTGDYWNRKLNPPGLFRAVVEKLKAQHSIDASRIYLFGHSAGAEYALSLALTEGNYYAAAAVHAGTMNANNYAPNRRIPIALLYGTRDTICPPEIARQIKTILESIGFPVELNLLPGHDHDYFAQGGIINKIAWEFLKKAQLFPSER